MERLPDFLTLSDADLDQVIDKLTKEESRISYERRLLQGRLDMLRAERTARKKSCSPAPVTVEELAKILSRKARPDGPQ
jgi:hypothetical protein